MPSQSGADTASDRDEVYAVCILEEVEWAIKNGDLVASAALPISMGVLELHPYATDNSSNHQEILP